MEESDFSIVPLPVEFAQDVRAADQADKCAFLRDRKAPEFRGQERFGSIHDVEVGIEPKRSWPRNSGAFRSRRKAHLSA